MVLGARGASYKDYETHQFNKMGANDSATGPGSRWIRKFDVKNGQDLGKYLFSLPGQLVGSPVLCVGARLGGEVRAFNTLPQVSLAVGVDFNPGERNPLVMYGDAHDLHQFKAGSFGSMYSNVIDHIMHIDRFASEARRVLVPRGTLLVHMLHQSLEQDKWAVRDMIKEHKAIDSQIVAAGFEHAVPPLHQKNYARMLIHKYVYRSTAK